MKPQPPLLLFVMSRGILAGVVAFLTLSVFTLFYPETAGSGVAYGGAIILFAGSLPFGIVVFLAVDRRNVTATRAATWFCFGAAGFTVVGTVANLGEMIVYGPMLGPVAVSIFILVGSGIAYFFAVSAISFRKWIHELESARSAMDLSKTQ
jgi:hypothetical protein